VKQKYSSLRTAVPEAEFGQGWLGLESSTSTLNTLHVDLGREWRGGQSQALNLIRGLRARGHKAELIALRDGPLARRAVAEGVRVATIGRWATRVRAALELRRLTATRKFDLVHAHEAHALTAAWLAGAYPRLAVVASRRLAYPLQQNRFALARYRRAARILAISRFVAESVVASGVPRARVAVVNDGVEIPSLPSTEERRHARERWGIAPQDPLLGCVGYLLAEKGQEFLVRALPVVRGEYPDCKLLLAGGGPLRPSLERLAAELGVSDAVRFLGIIDDVSQVYAALNVFIFPSLAEPLGSSLLAAMANGLPVVAGTGGAVPEVIDHERNGLLVDGPDPQGLGEAMCRLLGDKELAARLGKAARETVVQRFTSDRMVEETLRNYRQLCVEERQA
jgi:glycosyltransferase involved in cell wall biosynthesis